MSTSLATATPTSTDIERMLITGDLSKLTPEQRLSYYNEVCRSLGLNPLTKPFAYITLNGKLTLYALKDATEQLRKIHAVSITAISSNRVDDCFVVTAIAQDRTGRADAATGAVAIGSLKGEALANALMKAETKAKRRVTLSICGLGMLDETEAESIPQALVIEAPQVKRAPLPDGHVYILKVVPTNWGGDVTVVDAQGEEQTHKTTERRLTALCEQIAQDGSPVALVFETISRGKNAGKQKLVAVKRWKSPEQIENERIDAELAAAEAAKAGTVL